MAKIFRIESEIFRDLETLCSSAGYIHVLAYLSFNDNIVQYDGYMTGKVMAASYKPTRTLRTEFSTLVGLMLKAHIDFNIPTPNYMQHLIDETETLLKELHECLEQPMLKAMQQTAAAQQAGLIIDEASPLRRGDVLREPIFYGGESAYNFQYRNLALLRYKQDDEWIYSNKGFRIEDAYLISGAITHLQNVKIAKSLKDMRKIDPVLWTFLTGFSFSVEEINVLTGISSEKISKFLAAFSVSIFPTNREFSSLGEFNAANALPIIRSSSGAYISMQNYGVVESLYESPFFWMANDKTYRDIAFTHRGAFTEVFIAKRLAVVFGSANVYTNVEILRKGKHVTEIDVLILFANRVLLIQCKSKRLTIEARKGNDLKIKDDFKKSIQDAYDQAYLCAVCLSDSSVSYQNGKDVIDINRSIKEIYPICVVSDHYPALAVQAGEFLKHKTDGIIQPPLVTDVFFIDTLAEMLASPLRFLSYINRRVNYGNKIRANNELTILGYHLQKNLWIEDGYDLMVLEDNVAMDLDSAMVVRRENLRGVKTPKGILTHLKNTYMGRALDLIEQREDAALIDFGFMLLTLSGKTLSKLNLGIKKIIRRAKADRKTHDLTIVFDEGSAGVTIHCGFASDCQIAEKLIAHCERRKYIHRAERWYGLSVQIENGLPKFGINLNYSWKQDDVMDEITRNLPKTENF